MNGYAIIIIILLFVIVAAVYDLEPAIHKFVYTISDIPSLNTKHVKDPAIYTLVVRLAYIIAILGLVKILLSRKKDE